MTRSAIVTGAGGFIGHHLVSYLRSLGYHVRGVDVHLPEYEPTRADEFLVEDLREPDAAARAVDGVDEVYQLAADMGGIGYITAVRSAVARNNVLVNAHMLEAAAAAGVERYFYASSACVYPSFLQESPDVRGLREQDAHPAAPEEGYGWEKLYSEKLCEYYRDERGLATRVARFHNIFGPLGTYQGGREKAPAAICRKVALAAHDDRIEVWGDGQQTRSFTYVSDCVEGIHRIARSDYADPLNLGTERLVSVDGLVALVAQVAGKRIEPVHDLTKPQGVRGRNSDNSLARQVLGWEPGTSLESGLAATYAWIAEQLAPPVGAEQRVAAAPAVAAAR